MTTTYTVDPAHSSAHFSVKHLAIATVRGEFTALTGSLQIDPTAPESAHVEATIDVNSIRTGQPDRDTHLKAAEFFDVATYPTITFSSTSVTKDGDDEATIVGNLTLHGVTKEVTIKVEGGLEEVKDPWGNLKLGFSGQTKIKRSDFGLIWNATLEGGGLLIGDVITINLDVQFAKSV
jgi:polyisoprenoid-binding protein YceI